MKNYRNNAFDESKYLDSSSFKLLKFNQSQSLKYVHSSFLHLSNFDYIYV